MGFYYTVRRMPTKNVHIAADYFEVTKWDEWEPIPKNSYDVEIMRANKKGNCNCPAGMYHRKPGVEDKHVIMVKKWLAAGEPEGGTCT